MLYALREIVAAGGDLRVRAGANRGRAFAVHLGAPQRRTYTTMGDTTNLAARVMGKAPDGAVLATRAVLEHVRAPFARTAVEPFPVKGKSVLVEAEIIGQPQAVAERVHRGGTALAGREAELGRCVQRSPPPARATGASSSSSASPASASRGSWPRSRPMPRGLGCAGSSSREARTGRRRRTSPCALRCAGYRGRRRRRGRRGAGGSCPRASAAGPAAVAAARGSRSASICPPPRSRRGCRARPAPRSCISSSTS